MSKFWKVYASINDDLRHSLVEEAWFGKQLTGNINETDMPGIKDAKRPEEPKEEPKHEAQINNFYGETKPLEPGVGNLYASPTGTAPEISEPKIEAPTIEPSKTPDKGYPEL